MSTLRLKLWLLLTSLISCLLLGKWCRVERYDVPEDFVQALLADMPNAFINSAREKRHLRPPVWKNTSKVMHYRSFDISDMIAALGQRSGVTLHLKKAYLGDKEVADCTMHPLDGKTALEAAKAKAHSRSTGKSATQQLQIVVGHGEGRATREFELIWWPEMFSTSNHGKLVLRFYVSKVNL